MMSNSNNIEQYIRTHRQAFDTHTPGSHCWAGVVKTLDRLENADPLERQILLERPQFDHAAPSGQVWQAIEKSLNGLPGQSLEDFIAQNRESFDNQMPDLRVWASIEKAIPAKASKMLSMSWQRSLVRIAAAVALLIAGVNIGIWYAGNTASEQAGMAMSDISPEYAELEQYYQRDISAKQNKLANFAAYRDKDVTNDLLQMDQVLTELREELALVPLGNREQVVRAMIENYKAKAAILERVLSHLEQQQPNQQQPATINSGNHEVKKI